MRRRVRLPLLIVLMFAPFSLQTLQTPYSAQPAPASQSQTLREAAWKEVPDSCPVTKPPAHLFVPPSPYPTETGPDGFWFGTDKLWIQLPTDGTWKGLPHYKPTDTAFRQKLLWWRKGFDGRNNPQPMLKVTGKRLDSSTSPLETDDHANASGGPGYSFIVVGIDIPTLGCWKISGRFEDAELSFVIWVTQ